MSLLLICFTFVFTVSSNAYPMGLTTNVIPVAQYVSQETQPYQLVVSPSPSHLMEVSDDDSYDDRTPAGAIDRPIVVAVLDRANDLSTSASDLQASATGHGGGYDAHGWLDMGAYSGGHGAFGWYADYPVGGGHGYGR